MLNPGDYPALSALAAVLRTGSFEAAAAALGVTPSAVSQRVKGLEDRLGTPLVLRASPCRPTETGLRLARHAEDVGLLEAQLARDLGAPPAPAPLRLAVNADSLATWFVAAMAGHEGPLYRLEIDDQDHSADWLRRGEVVGAVSARETAVAGCDIYPLGALRYLAVATPAFVARHFPDGLTAEAFARAPSLVYDEKDRLQDNWSRRIAGRSVPLPAHRIPSTQGFVDAARAGLGWGLNPAALLADDLARGRLVALSPNPVDIPLYWHVSRLNRAVLAPLTTAVRVAAVAALVQ
ncbi:LysR family transcriptional regulator ArgP [Celeribacter indicus]|uniref:Chromosome replication initiation inhibitor protein n=1 Tax=Celeribacter indicus TaxID=1208324 RepID=A0A0B5DT72_9RHOB|nr:LysR family transcriptional regulator ArgP [Celeribacter indicus]AJE46249.1 chromosome replication initiation inhibitor protein [Celeribacter indicus]SDW51087.1 LysR family transcriptional regulator, chromosome initiation inhibitor [Celeribacter indicus]